MVFMAELDGNQMNDLFGVYNRP